MGWHSIPVYKSRLYRQISFWVAALFSLVLYASQCRSKFSSLDRLKCSFYIPTHKRSDRQLQSQTYLHRFHALSFRWHPLRDPIKAIPDHPLRPSTLPWSFALFPVLLSRHHHFHRRLCSVPLNPDLYLEFRDPRQACLLLSIPLRVGRRRLQSFQRGHELFPSFLINILIKHISTISGLFIIRMKQRL